MPRMIPVKERLLSHLRTDDSTGCWIWTGSTRNGYGRIGMGGRGAPMESSHRLAYRFFVGEIEILHSNLIRGLLILV